MSTKVPVGEGATGLTVTGGASGTRCDDRLVKEFTTPPEHAMPRVWWHWINGNITKQGIERDLQWMKRIGIGGLHNFDGALDATQIVGERLIYMSPGWRDAFCYATRLADALGLEFGLASSPGWSETGGPWVEPRDAMKKLVWSETRVPGGRPFKGRLAAPPSESGPFQNIPIDDDRAVQERTVLRFYGDVAVVAYRVPERLLRDPLPIKITTSSACTSAAMLAKGDASVRVALPASREQPAWIMYDYGTPHAFRSASVGRPSKFSITVFNWVVEASDDGRSFRRVAELPNDYMLHHVTVTFPETQARYLRLTMSPITLEFWFDYAANAPGAEVVPPFAHEPMQVELYEVRYYAGARVNRFEEKAGYAVATRYYALDSEESGVDEVVDPNDIIDLGDRVDPLGILSWTPPEGQWAILRLGYSLTGKTNHPASPEATGLEVDKLDRHAVKAYLDTYFDNFERTVGRDWIGSKGIRAFVTDSIETRGQNWTPALMQKFKAARGYELERWLPALTGVIIGDGGRTDRFLWDFRETLRELISDSHYGQIAESARSRGLTYYSESLEGFANMALGDDLDMRSHADIPMAAIWTNYKAIERDGIVNHIGDMLGAASVAHVLGKNLIAAESFTSGYEPWAFCPATLRPVADLAFALGVNRPVIHTSAHQPEERKPGITLGNFGQHFTRHETWAEMAGAWMTYLSRTAYLLQQGSFVADVAWFYGEEGSLAGVYNETAPSDLPEGYGFDFVNANILRHHLYAENGHLLSSGGARYRLLYLGGSASRMTLSVLRKLKGLADEGVLITGSRPSGSPSLADDTAQEEYQRLVQELWGSGKIKSTRSPNTALESIGLGRDFWYQSAKPDARILFVHRRLSQGDLYFVTNRVAQAQCIEAHFRVIGMRPELWRADTGAIEPVSWKVEEGYTVVSLELCASQSAFVVFREATSRIGENVDVPDETIIKVFCGEWQLNFEGNPGAPIGTLFMPLVSWTARPEPEIRFFSGIGTYRRSFSLGSLDLKTGERVFIDLGEVHELAEVTLNEKLIGTAWHAPFRLDITNAIRDGTNTLVVRVANLWVNRLIGDKQPGSNPVAFTMTSTYQPDASLRASGLIGPVKIVRCQPMTISRNVSA